MIATIISEKKKHYPVLLKEVTSIISPQYGGTFIDCTFGQGGYTKKILDFHKTKVIALDRDKDSIKIANDLKEKFQNRFKFENIKFSEINNLSIDKKDVKAIIFDLGCSLEQIKDPKKGLSFSSKGELNMKLGLNSFSAKDAINKLDQKQLENILKFFGEEKEYRRIAYKIIKEREKKEIDTPGLVKIIESSKRKKNYKIHCATKTFQALRIFVNKEISELINGLINATKILEKNGKIVIISFHSLEDRIVKYFFKSLSENKSSSRYMPKLNEKKNLLKLINKKPIIPNSIEITKNPPSRSAKLRSAIKQFDISNIETDIFEKFKNLIEIENYSKKL
jgi:16S rRNA (cytosine1402-N4)-methyltransferase